MDGIPLENGLLGASGGPIVAGIGVVMLFLIGRTVLARTRGEPDASGRYASPVSFWGSMVVLVGLAGMMLYAPYDADAVREIAVNGSTIELRYQWPRPTTRLADAQPTEVHVDASCVSQRRGGLRPEYVLNFALRDGRHVRDLYGDAAGMSAAAARLGELGNVRPSFTYSADFGLCSP